VFALRLNTVFDDTDLDSWLTVDSTDFAEVDTLTGDDDQKTIIAELSQATELQLDSNLGTATSLEFADAASSSTFD
jgi:hypothetical protein